MIVRLYPNVEILYKLPRPKETSGFESPVLPYLAWRQMAARKGITLPPSLPPHSASTSALRIPLSALHLRIPPSTSALRIPPSASAPSYRHNRAWSVVDLTIGTL